MADPIFVSERDFDERPQYYIDLASADQEVAVFDANNRLVLSMGGTVDVRTMEEKQIEQIQTFVEELEEERNKFEPSSDLYKTFDTITSKLRKILETE